MKNALLSLSVLLLGAPALLAVDCFDNFQIDVNIAEKELSEDLDWCDNHASVLWMCLLDAEVTYEYNLGKAADRYGACCDLGGGGCG